VDQLDRRPETLHQVSDRRRFVGVRRQLDMGVQFDVRTAVGLPVVRVPGQLRYAVGPHRRIHKARVPILTRALRSNRPNRVAYRLKIAQTLRSRTAEHARPVSVRTVEVPGTGPETNGLRNRPTLSGTNRRPRDRGPGEPKSKRSP